MKHIFILVSLFASSLLGYGQGLEVEYDHLTSFPTNSTEAVYKLQIQGNRSVYYKHNANFVQKVEDGEVIRINQGIVPFVIKDFSTKKTTYNQPVINTIVFISDELPMQVWTLKNETKKIKSFTCKKATTSFRGRTYTAWYTEELSVIGGPWKFDGLPGLILAVSSDDNVLNIEATKIEKKTNIKLTQFNLKKEKLITWKEYTQQMEKTIERLKKNILADSDPDVEYDFKIDLVEKIEP